MIVAAATRGPREVRLAALRACGRIGDRSCLEPLLTVGADPDADLAAAARTALGDIRDPAVDEEILRLARSPGPGSRAPVFDLVGQRRLRKPNVGDPPLQRVPRDGGVIAHTRQAGSVQPRPLNRRRCGRLCEGYAR